MKRRWIFLICLFATGCNAVSVSQSKIPSSNFTSDNSVRAKIGAPKKLTADASIKTNVLAPTQAKVSLFPERTTPEQPEITQQESQVMLASTQSQDYEADNFTTQTESLEFGNEPIDSMDEKKEKDSEPSPHDINLSVPETEELIKTSPTPEARKPKAFAYDVPIVRNAIVDRWIEYFTGPGRASFSFWLSRGGRYINLFREILKEHQLPQDLAYLSLIESGFNPKARSIKGAVGPWQFMPGTARRMGLKINYYLDERRHPMKSTRAAAAYLSKLYEEFGDWHLALAAYNAGENRIAKTMRRSGLKDYWSLARTRHLPNETRNYVAKYLAGMIIAKNPEVFGFANIDYETPWNLEAVQLTHGTSLRAISRLSKVSFDTLRKINAELRTSVTPPGNGYHLFLPNEAAKEFNKKLAKLHEFYRSAPDSYHIQPGDTFGAIAQKLDIPLDRLMELNTHLHPRRLQVGAKILLPKSINTPKADRPNSATGSITAMPDLHIVQRGESFWLIAQKYGISSQELLQSNTGIDPKRLRIGMKIRLPLKKHLVKHEKTKEKETGGKSTRHLVEPGENVSIIAHQYGVRTEVLLAWNRLSPSAKIFPGEKLIVHR